MPFTGAMKLPKDDNDLRGDDSFDEDHEALFASSTLNAPKVNPVINCCVTVVAFFQFMWIFRRTEFLLSLVLFISVSLAATGTIESYEHKKHSFKHHQFYHEYSDIKSPLELKLKDIDHWCIDGSDDNCPQCDDPTHPISRGEYDGWKDAFMRNVHLSNDFKKTGAQPDVIFLGDSTVEATVGTLKGIAGLDGTTASKELDMIKEHYDKKFIKAQGGKYDAIRLGIAGDTSPNVFWRIKQNEMRSLSPKVWWIEVGRNDLFRTKCSEEVTLMGVIRVVEELVSKNDGATIVINSILPTATKNTLQLDGNYAHNDMWKSIEEVNRRLKKFSQKHHHVVFYDADEIFVESRYKKKYISKKLYADKVHPSFAGYKALASSQLEFLDSIMEKRKNKAQTGNEGPKTQNGNSPSSTQGNTSEDQDKFTPEGNYDGDDYYGYLSLFHEDDDFLNTFNLYGSEDDFLWDDDDW